LSAIKSRAKRKIPAESHRQQQVQNPSYVNVMEDDGRELRHFEFSFS
jgi:hypothetical protein